MFYNTNTNDSLFFPGKSQIHFPISYLNVDSNWKGNTNSFYAWLNLLSHRKEFFAKWTFWISKILPIAMKIITCGSFISTSWKFNFLFHMPLFITNPFILKFCGLTLWHICLQCNFLFCPANIIKKSKLHCIYFKSGQLLLVWAFSLKNKTCYSVKYEWFYFKKAFD